MGFLTRGFNRFDEDDHPLVAADKRPIFVATDSQGKPKENKDISRVFEACRILHGVKQVCREARDDKGGSGTAGYDELFS